MKNQTPIWTEDRVEKLKKLWLTTDMTAEQVAVELGGLAGAREGGRMVVLGKLHRLGLPARRDPRGLASPEERQRAQLAYKERENARRRATRAAKKAKEMALCGLSAPTTALVRVAKPKVDAPPFIGSLNLLFGELRRFSSSAANQCRYIEPSDNGPNFRACGTETLRGASYCGHHHPICHYAGSTTALSDAERKRRSNHGKALGFASVKRHRMPTLFPAGETAAAFQPAEAGA
jgi:hypothetical protein